VFDFSKTPDVPVACGERKKVTLVDETVDITGTMKWFDPSKGFGFILGDNDEVDILLHANVLRNFGQNSVVDGAGIVVKAQKTERGWQAVEVVSITPPVGLTTPPLDDLAHLTEEERRALPVSPARVKWFDKGKGFGFANMYRDGRDIFLHIEVLRRSGLSDLVTGEAVALRLMEGPRGLMATEIMPWDTSSED